MNKTPEDLSHDAARARDLMLSLTNHPIADSGVVDDIEALRTTAKQYGALLIEVCPDSRERSLAITRLEESLMWAVKSMVLPR